MAIESRSEKNKEVNSFNYYTIKVDNPDMQVDDVRFIDENGLSNFYGRVEIRKSGRWGYVKEISSDA